MRALRGSFSRLGAPRRRPPGGCQSGPAGAERLYRQLEGLRRTGQTAARSEGDVVRVDRVELAVQGRGRLAAVWDYGRQIPLRRRDPLLAREKGLPTHRRG